LTPLHLRGGDWVTGDSTGRKETRGGKDMREGRKERMCKKKMKRVKRKA
jgi:hypothetical protein